MTRILVVEDEPTIAIGLHDDLQIEGFDVEVVSDGEAEWDRLLRMVERRGKGRIELAVELRAGLPREGTERGAVVGSFWGTFVALTQALGQPP
jgi:DNA-binding response OmpR family regulator